MDLTICGKQAKEAASILNNLGVIDKNRGLAAAAASLLTHQQEILIANDKDMQAAKEAGMKPSLQDRLKLTPQRIESMAKGLKQIIQLEDPVGQFVSMSDRPNGLTVGKKRVSLGVVAMIYEARPNVTADAFGLCFKTGNAVILKGGSDALNSNIAIYQAIVAGLKEEGLPEYSLQLITDTNRETTKQLMRLNEYVDILIPRGSTGLIRTVVENSTVPVIETGIGNCHVYVDESADINMAVEIIYNAKTQRIGVCNACESVVIHKNVVRDIMPLLVQKLSEKSVEIRGDQRILEVCSNAVAATEEDWGTEYLDYIISIKTVNSLEEAIDHINHYGTGHSEAIITESYQNAQKFLKEIDAACVYVNASTRFSDGNEFGFGAEIGISTQKLHARGPMGLEALTTTKFIIYGSGQVRP